MNATPILHKMGNVMQINAKTKMIIIIKSVIINISEGVMAFQMNKIC